MVFLVVTMRPKTSPIWNYFLELSASAARCKVCEKQYSRKGRTTTALKSHLKSSHPEKYQEFIRLDVINKETTLDNTKPVASSSVSTVQAKIRISLQEDNLNKNELYDSLSKTKKSQQIDRLIAEMITLQDLPFSFVEGIGFRRLMNTALPEYQLKERQFYTSLVYDDLYIRVQNKIKQLLNEFEKLSFTIDIWSELNSSISLISLIAYGINKNFQRVKIALKCEVVEGDHTEQELSFKIQSVLQEWDIKQQTLHCMICDQGSNMISPIQLSGIDNLDCIIHQIHACIQSIIQSEEWLERLIAKLEKITAHFNQSIIAQEDLKKIQIEKLNESPLCPVQDYPTRWNSSFYMMERFLKIKDSIVLYLSTKQITTISYDDWLNIEKYVKILKPFEEITRELSSPQNSISSVIPLIQVLLTTLQNEEAKDDTLEEFKRVVKKLIAKLNFRFNDLNKNISYTVSTYLDPRYKAKFFNEIVIDEVETTIIHELFTSRYFDNEENEGGPSTSKKIKRENEHQPSTSRQANLFQYSDLEFSLESILSTNESDGDEDEDTKDQLTMVKTMLDNYKKEKRLPLKEDPLLWWHMNAYKYSALVPVVRRFLSPPPSSVVSDQFFTGAVRIFDEDGHRLCGEKAEKILFLKYNLPLLDFNY